MNEPAQIALSTPSLEMTGLSAMVYWAKVEIVELGGKVKTTLSLYNSYFADK